MTKKSKGKETDVSRREFLKTGGAIAAGLQIGAVAGAGLAAGRDPSTLTGWQHLGDNTQFVNRKKLEIKGPAYEIVGKTRRPENVESVFGRSPMMYRDMMQYIPQEEARDDPGEGAKEKRRMPAVEQDHDVAPEVSGGIRPDGPRRLTFPPADQFSAPLLSYYKEMPHVYELDKVRTEEIMPKREKDEEKYGEFYTLIEAWSNSWGTHEDITEPPEISDFHLGSGRRAEKIGPPAPFKSPAHAARLIKKVAHHFGATMVGITTVEPDWCYNHHLRRTFQPHLPRL